eukprot:TRINITY_DN10639_c0_g1_i1.p1 TRINITY_DN10639_c0_g1~~TRINITY_DN10639_c0_g1_i1.p1  ORF type:complete len:305 (-),score=44.21 TRINITY_DN10639_c0_g1_i1:87-962(-)
MQTEEIDILIPLNKIWLGSKTYTKSCELRLTDDGLQIQVDITEEEVFIDWEHISACSLTTTPMKETRLIIEPEKSITIGNLRRNFVSLYFPNKYLGELEEVLLENEIKSKLQYSDLPSWMTDAWSYRFYHKQVRRLANIFKPIITIWLMIMLFSGIVEDVITYQSVASEKMSFVTEKVLIPVLNYTYELFLSISLPLKILLLGFILITLPFWMFTFVWWVLGIWMIILTKSAGFLYFFMQVRDLFSSPGKKVGSIKSSIEGWIKSYKRINKQSKQVGKIANKVISKKEKKE